MVNKRAQAALEFLMTYGWAILVVLAAIGALAYFGVLSPSNFVPERCVTSNPATSCAGGKGFVNGSMIAFTIHVSAGYSSLNFTNNGVITSNSGVGTCASWYKNTGSGNLTGTATTNVVTEDNDVTIVGSGCTGELFTAGERINIEVDLTPTNVVSGLPDPITASLSTKVQ